MRTFLRLADPIAILSLLPVAHTASAQAKPASQAGADSVIGQYRPDMKAELY